MTNSALIGMSGGVDSSVAAHLMVKSGYACTGTMMKLFANEDIGRDSTNTCCTLDDADDARAVADKLGIPFFVFNYVDCFREQVISRFVSAYSRGHTPNPCIDCNRYVRFDMLLRRARELGLTNVVTGHYARITYNAATGRHELKKGLDPAKDQSYMLYSLTQDVLAHTIFPLGAMHKPQVREIAQAQGFINAKKRDSQDICFVPDGDYPRFIERHTGVKSEKGNFIDVAGNILGEHRGVIHYTVGQRRGLGISAASPLYVIAVDPAQNTSYLFDNVQRKLERNLSVRISDLDYDAFDLEDVDALADLYNERDERCCAVVTTSDNVRRMKPVAAASSYC